MLSLTDKNGMNWYPIFASNSASVALIGRQAGPNNAGPLPIRIIELPSAKELRRFDLPGLPERQWLHIRRWDGRYLLAVQIVQLESEGRKEWQQITFDTSTDPLGEGTIDPMLRLHEESANDSTFWSEAPDRAAFGKIIRGGQKSRLDEVREWLTAKLGIDLTPQHQIRANVRIVDRATGETRYQLPRPLAITICLSRDGRRLAATHDHDSIEVWNVDPPPRWPFALSAGALSFGGILAFGRWRRRRELARVRSV